VIHFPIATFKVIRKVKYNGYGLGRQVVHEKRKAAQQGLETNKDVFSLLLNLSHTKQVLDEEDIVAQTVVPLIAGQDTTVNTLTFGLLELARHPEFQDKLRTEIHSALGVGSGNIAYDSIPLLNAFIKETLRLYPALPMEDRIALEDVVIPLSESINTSTGEHISQVPIRKGQLVNLAIGSYQRLELLWGPDAHQFDPSRWIEGKNYRGEAIGPYANLLSFFGGSRTCLGWRFAILEMQVVLCELVSKFSFALPEGDFVRARSFTALIPVLATGEKGAYLQISRIS